MVKKNAKAYLYIRLFRIKLVNGFEKKGVLLIDNRMTETGIKHSLTVGAFEFLGSASNRQPRNR